MKNINSIPGKTSTASNRMEVSGGDNKQVVKDDPVAIICFDFQKTFDKVPHHQDFKEMKLPWHKRESPSLDK